MAIFIFGLLALYFLVRLVLTVLFLGAPALILISPVLSGMGREHLPDPDDFIDPAVEYRYRKILTALSAVSASVDQYYEMGRRNAITLTSKSDGRRFDARKSLGKELNAALDQAYETAVQYHSFRIACEAERDAMRTGYFAEVRKWAFPTSAKYANWAAIAAFGTVLFASLGSGIGNLAASAVVANPFSARPGLVAALIAATVVYGIVFLASVRRRTGQAVHSERYEERAEVLAAHYQPDISNEDEEAASEQIDPEASSDTEEWHAVLDVDPDASIEQIKAAYRTAIKQYHPDSVEGRGQKIKDLAQQETQRINAAYATAKAARGASI